MGHYDDARKEHEAEELAEDAKASGMTVTAYVKWKNHEDKMNRGRELYQQRRDEDKLIAYFKDHRFD